MTFSKKPVPLFPDHARETSCVFQKKSRARHIFAAGLSRAGRAPSRHTEFADLTARNFRDLNATNLPSHLGLGAYYDLSGVDTISKDAFNACLDFAFTMLAQLRIEEAR